ncbi:MAG: hypothetical protein ACKVS9_01155 [Phycisphaerae bacterium]
MNTKQLNRKRRATILLLVVSILALLFVIVTGFLSVARNTRQLVVEAERGATVDSILAQTVESALGAVGGGTSNVDPGDYVSNGATEMIPGYGAIGRLVSPVAPVRNVGIVNESSTDPYRTFSSNMAGADELARVVWPTVANFETDGQHRGRAVSLLDMIIENPDDLNREIEDEDFERVARQSRFDADGDGVPDSSLLGAAILTETANGKIGSPVAIRGLLQDAFATDPTESLSFLRLDNQANEPPGSDRARLRRALEDYEQNARFEISFRMVPHGGMIALDSVAASNTDGTAVVPPNRYFVQKTLENLSKYPLNAQGRRQDATLTNITNFPIRRRSELGNVVFEEIANSRAAVERQLRRRGGWLPAYALFPGMASTTPGATTLDTSNDAVPPILSFLQGTLPTRIAGFPDNSEDSIGFPRTFLPDYRVNSNAAKVEPSQRFNLGEYVGVGDPQRIDNERVAAMLAIAPSVDELIDGAPGADALLARRAYFTTISNSDEIARKQDPSTPVRSNLVRDEADRRQYAVDPLFARDANFPNTLVVAPADAGFGVNLGLPENSTKFYLGDLFSYRVRAANGRWYTPFTEDPPGSENYIYVPSVRDVRGNRLKVGDAVIERLASYFYDMLGGHSANDPSTIADANLDGEDDRVDTNGDGQDDRIERREDWSDARFSPLTTFAPNNTPAGLFGAAQEANKQAVSRRQQAIMLAVNTMAFAAPRSTSARNTAVRTNGAPFDTRGFPAGQAFPVWDTFGGEGYVDAVSYVDWSAPLKPDEPATTPGVPTFNEYVGWGPQLIFSECASHSEFDENDPDSEPEVSFAVELFNPNDPLFVGNGTDDLHALSLWDFAISINGFNPNLDADGEPQSDEGQFDDWHVLGAHSVDPSVGGRTFVPLPIQIDMDETRTGSAFTGGNPNPRQRPHFKAEPLRGGASGGIDPIGIGDEYRDLTGDWSYYTLDLWRKGVRLNAAGAREIYWYNIDRIHLPVPQDVEQTWFAAVARDMTPSRHIRSSPELDALVNAGYPASARWRGVTGRVQVTGVTGSSVSQNPSSAFLGSPKWLKLSSGAADESVDPDVAGFSDSFAPELPLYTMNASPNPITADVDGTDLHPDTPPTRSTGKNIWDMLTNLPMGVDYRERVPGNNRAANYTDTRPRSFPTVGFMMFVPRFSHFRHIDARANQIPAPADASYARQRDVRVPMSVTLGQQWRNRYTVNGQVKRATEFGSGGLATDETYYPVDFGHMPIFDNSQRTYGEVAGIDVAKRHIDAVGSVPWGQLVFDYFSTVNPERIDPYQVPGRIDINAAPWLVMSQLPMLGPVTSGTTATGAPVPARRIPGTPVEVTNAELPIRAEMMSPTSYEDFPRQGGGGPGGTASAARHPSPAFWQPRVGGLVGLGFDRASGLDTAPRFAPLEMRLGRPAPANNELPRWPDGDRQSPSNVVGDGIWRIGSVLGVAAASYRDGVQQIENQNGLAEDRYADAHLRNPVEDATSGALYAPRSNQENVTRITGPYRPLTDTDGDGIGETDAVYGKIRGQALSNEIGPSKFGFVSIGELANVKGFDGTRPEQLRIDAQPSQPGFSPVGTNLMRGDFLKSVSMIAMLDSNYITTRSNTFTVYISIMDREDPSQSVRTQMTIDRSNLIKQIGRSSPRGQMPEIISETRVGYFNTRYDQ